MALLKGRLSHRKHAKEMDLLVALVKLRNVLVHELENHAEDCLNRAEIHVVLFYQLNSLTFSS